MKRLLCTILIAAMLLSMFLLPACSEKTNPTDTQATTLPSGTTPSDPTSAPTDPTDEPTDPVDPTDEPTDPIEPTEVPTDPTETPTDPTEAPTSAPTEAPTQKPTEPPATEPSATEPPATEPSATEPPATEPPATEPPATEPPATEPPATEPPATEPPQEPERITILGPEGEVYPYVDNARNYLLKGGDVASYASPATQNGVKPIEITWKADFTPKKFYIRYSTDETFATYKEVSVSGSKNNVKVYNLLKGATYYVRVSAVDDAGKEHVATSSFYTTSIGPRVMFIEGVFNVRDVGGYQTSFGKTTVQNLLFRGGALVPCQSSNASITYAGMKFASQELGIKLDLDVRLPSQSNYDGKTSIIPGAALKYGCIGGYTEAFSATISGYRMIFQELAKVENYPIYMHCTGGADRTGTVCFLLNALLGVDEKELIQDFEFTTFSAYGTRSTKSGTYATRFADFYNKLNTFEGDNLTEKVESYLKWIGIKQAEINTIRGIMFGEIPIPAAEG